MICDILKCSTKKYGDKFAVCQNDYNITYNSLWESVKNLSSQFKRYINNDKCNVIILFDNSIDFVKMFFALNLSGAVIIPVYYNTSVKKIIELIDYYDIELLITSKEKTDIINKNDFYKCDCLTNIMYIDNDEIISWYTKEQKRICEEYKHNDLALILLTSGTTGMSKGIMLSNKNVESNVESISSYLKLDKEDKILLIKNINHVSSIIGEMMVSIFNGCAFYITNKLITPVLILKLIEKYQISILFAVPVLLKVLINCRSIDNYDYKSLRLINFYGAPAGEQLIDNLNDKFNEVKIIYSYGQTEASPRITHIEGDDLLKRNNSCGKAIKDVEISINNQIKPFIVGEVLVRGPNVMIGIYKNKSLTEERLKDEYLHTNDLGYLDNEGFLYIVGRVDNMFIQAGKNIYPEEIEEVLLFFNGVKEAFVKGVKDEMLGRKIVAFIVTDKEFYNLKELKEYIKNNLDDYKIPREIKIVDFLKKTASGKIKRGDNVI